jgi:hypothetical protein
MFCIPGLTCRVWGLTYKTRRSVTAFTTVHQCSPRPHCHMLFLQRLLSYFPVMYVFLSARNFVPLHLAINSLCIWDLRCSSVLRSVGWELRTYVLGQPIWSHLQGSSSPSCLDFLTLEYGTDNNNTNNQQNAQRVLSSIVTHSYVFRPCWVIFRENFLLSLH